MLNVIVNSGLSCLKVERLKEMCLIFYRVWIWFVRNGGEIGSKWW